MIAFTFPGQGSQKPGMGAAWVDHPSWEIVEEASAAAGRDIADLLLNADADELKQTRNSQLATFILSLVAFDAVTRIGVETNGYAGHSLGEYSALTAAGVLEFDDAVRLVTERGEAMQQTATERDGAMAAVLGLDEDRANAACMRVSDEVWVANFNAPGQVVIAGSPEGVEAASAAAKELGAKRVMPLPVSGAFHTPFMTSARNRLGKALNTVEYRAPDQPVYANVDASPHLSSVHWEGLLNSQLCSPVRWRQTLHKMEDDSFSRFVELGPGAVLTGTVKRTLHDASTLKVNVPDDLDGLLEALADSPKAGEESLDGEGLLEALADSPKAGEESLDGEALYATERLVVSPAAGLFDPVGDTAPGTEIKAGHLLGYVGDTEVRSAFSGVLMDYIAVVDERVKPRQPIAWLRTEVDSPTTESTPT